MTFPVRNLGFIAAPLFLPLDPGGVKISRRALLAQGTACAKASRQSELSVFQGKQEGPCGWNGVEGVDINR